MLHKLAYYKHVDDSIEMNHKNKPVFLLLDVMKCGK
jgi:hypothetical protein